MLLYFRRYPLYVFVIAQIILFIAYQTTKNSICLFNPIDSNKHNYEWVGPNNYISTNHGTEKYPYDENMPLIFIGGMPRSGTTLLRVLLDAHPDIRCGEETRIIPRILSYRQTWMKSTMEAKRLEEAGVSSDVLDHAVRQFILEVIVRHGKPAPRLCNKDPFTLRSAVYLHSLFPNAKYIFIIRDGRAVVHSIISRKVSITGFDLTNFRQCLTKWNVAMVAMDKQCKELGPNICFPVHYEQLVLHPKLWMEKILQFLNVRWNDTVLHHDQFVSKGDIKLSKLERSTDQVIKPINLEALSKWVGNIPQDVVDDMENIAPMLAKLGYDPKANPPNYGEPDSFVVQNMNELEQNRDDWMERERMIKESRAKLQEKLAAAKRAAAAQKSN